MFSVDSESFAEGGFRKAYKCESIDGKLSGKWVLKKYKENALKDMESLNLTEEEHARKQVQMHTLAQNITTQMQRNVPETFGETFSYDSMLFWKITENNGDACFVTIERYGGEWSLFIGIVGGWQREMLKTSTPF